MIIDRVRNYSEKIGSMAGSKLIGDVRICIEHTHRDDVFNIAIQTTSEVGDISFRDTVFFGYEDSLRRYVENQENQIKKKYPLSVVHIKYL